MTDESLRSVTLSRTDTGRYVATNARGLTMELGSGHDDLWSPVELLLAAIAGCSAVDVDVVTGRRTPPETFEVLAEGHKHRDEGGNVMRDLSLVFKVTFPEGEEGDAARAILPRAVATSHDRTCTVSRTVEAGVPVAVSIDETAS